MKIEHLRQFIAIAQGGTYQEVADSLYISRPTLSNHMKALEREVGFPLFDSQENETVLTDKGAMFLKGAMRAVSSYDDGVRRCRAVASGDDEGAVCVDFRVSSVELRAALSRFCDVPFTYAPYNPRRPLLYSFSQGMADVGVVYDLSIQPSLRAEAQRLGLVFEPYGQERCFIVMRDDNPLAQGPLTQERLEGVVITQLNARESGYWRHIVLDMFGDCSDLHFKLAPMDDNLLNMYSADLKDTIFISMETMVKEFFEPRENYVLRGDVDGRPLFMKRSLLYRPFEEKRGIDRVVGALRDHLKAQG